MNTSKCLLGRIDIEVNEHAERISAMNYVDVYELWYTGNGMHQLFSASKSSMDALSAANANSKQLAEYFLNKLDYAGRARSAMSYASGGLFVTATAANEHQRQLEHIHASCKDEIEAKWSRPMLSEDEVNDILFRDKVERAVSELCANKAFEIHL